MTDHPLVPSNIRQYMQQHSIEENLNKALNVVLAELPQDPLSTMAVKLLESNVSPPVVDRLVARETYICELS